MTPKLESLASYVAALITIKNELQASKGCGEGAERSEA